MSAEIVTHPAVGADDRRRWFALGVIVTAQFMVVLDISIVNVALPSIKTDLHFSQESLQWVITAYSIFFGGFLLLGGRLARSEEHTSELQSHVNLVCRLLLEKKKKK